MEPSPAFVQLASGADVVKIPIICIVFANGLVGYKAQIGYNLCTQSMELRALWGKKKREKKPLEALIHVSWALTCCPNPTKSDLNGSIFFLPRRFLSYHIKQPD